MGQKRYIGWARAPAKIGHAMNKTILCTTQEALWPGETSRADSNGTDSTPKLRNVAALWTFVELLFQFRPGIGRFSEATPCLAVGRAWLQFEQIFRPLD